LTFPIGTQDSAEWNAEDGEDRLPSVLYTYQDKKAIVTLQCSTNGTNLFEAFGEDPINTYIFRLTHRCACWNECRGKGIQNELFYDT